MVAGNLGLEAKRNGPKVVYHVPSSSLCDKILAKLDHFLGWMTCIYSSYLFGVVYDENDDMLVEY